MKSVWLDVWNQLQGIELKAATILKDTALEDMPMIQLHILEALYEKDGLHASTLARVCGRAATSFTPILDKVERRGLVCRMADPNDRRAIFIHLTPEGQSLRVVVQEAIDRLNLEFPKVRSLIKS